MNMRLLVVWISPADAPGGGGGPVKPLGSRDSSACCCRCLEIYVARKKRKKCKNRRT